MSADDRDGEDEGLELEAANETELCDEEMLGDAGDASEEGGEKEGRTGGGMRREGSVGENGRGEE